MEAMNYSKLRGRIVEILGTQLVFAQKMGLSETSVSKKMRGSIPWKQSEMILAAKILKFPETDIGLYFFCATRVQ